MRKSNHRKKIKSKSKRKCEGPGLFSDFGKKAKDLLTKGYSKDQRISISTCSDLGVTLTSTAARHGRDSSTGSVAALYNHKNTILNVNVNTETNSSATLTFTRKFFSSTKTIASFRLPDYNSSELKFQCFHENATLAMSIALNQSPAVKLSTTIGTSSIAFGMEAKYKITSTSFTEYNAGISVTKPNCNASIILAKKGDLLVGSYVHYLEQQRKIAAVVEITRSFSAHKNSFVVGGSCAVDNRTMLKARLDNCGKLKTLLEHKIIPKSYLTVSVEFNTKAFNKKPRIGLALALML